MVCAWPGLGDLYHDHHISQTFIVLRQPSLFLALTQPHCLVSLDDEEEDGSMACMHRSK